MRARQVVYLDPLCAVALIDQIQIQFAARHNRRIALRIAAHTDRAAACGGIAPARLGRAVVIAVNLREGLRKARADRLILYARRAQDLKNTVLAARIAEARHEGHARAVRL